MRCRIHPLRSSQHMRCRASVANHSMVQYIAAGCSGLAPPEVASNDTPIPSPRTPLVDTPVGDDGDRRCLPGCMISCTCEARYAYPTDIGRNATSAADGGQNAHGLDTQSALCIERGPLLRRVLNQLKANKVHGFGAPVQGVGCVIGMSIQNAVGIYCRPHLTINLLQVQGADSREQSDSDHGHGKKRRLSPPLDSANSPGCPDLIAIKAPCQ